jgi:hypothetical protein
MDWVRDSDPQPGLPKGRSKGTDSHQKGAKGNGKNKRFKTEPGNRLQAVERLARSTAALASKTARTVALLFSHAVITILCPALPALRKAAAIQPQDPNDPLEIQFQRWGSLVKHLGNDSKTSEAHAQTLRAHVSACSDLNSLRGKVLLCHVKATFRDSELFLIQIRVAAEFQHLAAAIIETLVKAGGNVSYVPASRSGEERQVGFDLAALDSL